MLIPQKQVPSKGTGTTKTSSLVKEQEGKKFKNSQQNTPKQKATKTKQNLKAKRGKRKNKKLVTLITSKPRKLFSKTTTDKKKF